MQGGKRFMFSYNPSSLKAEEFINHQEILDTLAYAEANKNNLELIDSIIEKAKLRKGLSHREAMVLLDCDNEEKIAEIYALAEQIKKRFLRQQNCYVRTALSFKLLRKRLFILPLPSQKQTHRKKETHTGRNQKRGYSTSGYGT
jgi:ribosomal protein L17